MSKWNSRTRCLSYNPQYVIERLEYYAREYRDRGDTYSAGSLEMVAKEIRLGRSPIKGAELVIRATEEFSEKDYECI